ncbi:MAG: hypothetical protein CMQ43_11965 [Gammaproteobacteria bacterium]|nr:hypothetical protein [Gammaproteobacteria bacterium]
MTAAAAIRRICLFALLAAGLNGAAVAAAGAGEIRAEAQVVDVVPVAGGDCQPPKPPAGTGLADLLAWDLRLGCEAPAAFRVFYRWDGRTFSRVMAERPGATVPVRVRVR